MEMEVVVPNPSPLDFNFDSSCSSPYMTAPSSPQRFGNFLLSAPTSPSRVSAFYQELNDFSTMATKRSSSSVSSVPFNWEERPGIPKCKPSIQPPCDAGIVNEDFEFNFSGRLDKMSLTAEELFEGGKIRPLKLPPRLQSSDSLSPPGSKSSSPRSKLSQGNFFFFQEALSPRHQRKDFDPFAAAIEATRKKKVAADHQPNTSLEFEQNRGRGKVSSSSSSSSRKGNRSLSPLRVSDILISTENEDNSPRANKSVPSATSNSKASFPPPPSSAYSSFLSSLPFSKGYRKWRLKDFLLFRSASEGRADGKDPLRKYTMLSRKVVEEDVKNSSFRSSESSGSVSRRRGTVSPHELHYTLNRAGSEELKKKTSLPYKHGLLGCMGFNSGMIKISHWMQSRKPRVSGLEGTLAPQKF